MGADEANIPVKTPFRVKAVAILLIGLFGLGTAFSVPTLLSSNRPPGSTLTLLFAIVINVAFVVAGIGLLKLKPWSLWLTVGLCALSIIQLLWQIFSTLTPETATKTNEMASYFVAGFYLAIAFFLTAGHTRSLFKKSSGA